MKDDELPAKWTKSKLAELNARDRYKLLESSRNTKLFDADTKERFVEAILESGPINDATSIRHDDPLALAIEDIVFSRDGRAACLSATEQGLPALAGIEAMIVTEVGNQYAATPNGTNIAGIFVGQLMLSLGYAQNGQYKMPAGSVAKTATVWSRPNRR